MTVRLISCLCFRQSGGNDEVHFAVAADTIRPTTEHAVLLGRVCNVSFLLWFNRLALKSGLDGHPESPQVGHSRSANTAQRLNSVYVVASSD